MTQALNLANFANYLNTSGQLSAAGLQAGVGVDIPSGSVVPFYQSAAPTGWTQVTTLNDYALRIVSGTGGTTGGSTAFSSVFTNQTPTINTSGLSAGATTLSTTQMPSHSHSISTNNSPGGGAANTTVHGDSCSGSGFNISTAGNGGGGSHTHSISGSATSSAITLNVQYANIILCSKN